MATVIENPPKVWTAEDLLAMPDDGVERWIIKGQLREKPSEFPGVKMTVRNRHLCEAMAFITTALKFGCERSRSHEAVFTVAKWV